jgi:hypothetical protein
MGRVGRCLPLYHPVYWLTISLSAWCWIANGSVESSRLKIGSEYAYFWLAAIVTFVLYGIIAVNWLREASAKRDRRLLRDAISMGW